MVNILNRVLEKHIILKDEICDLSDLIREAYIPPWSKKGWVVLTHPQLSYDKYKGAQYMPFIYKDKRIIYVGSERDFPLQCKIIEGIIEPLVNLENKLSRGL